MKKVLSSFSCKSTSFYKKHCNFADVFSTENYYQLIKKNKNDKSAYTYSKDMVVATDAADVCAQPSGKACERGECRQHCKAVYTLG
jgi:hypothetical protein